MGLYMIYYTRNGSDTICDVPPLSKDGSSSLGSLQGVITKVMMHNTSHTRIKHMNALKVKLYYNLCFKFDCRALSGRENKIHFTEANTPRSRTAPCPRDTDLKNGSR
jgi:hypothetical protein